MPKAAAGLQRCFWTDGSELYDAYHDREWGRPVTDDIRLFEKISLEGFQAGLSWITILKKREAFRAGFDGFDFRKVAAYTEADLQRLLGDAGIVRNRLKVDAAIHNAGVIQRLRASHGGFAEWLDAHVETGGRARTKAEWVKLFKRDLRFVGGEIVGEFLMSLGYLPGAHRADCPAARHIAKLKPRPVWMRYG